MKYMLDTDSVSYALRGQGAVGARVLEHKPSELCISAVTLAELLYGADKRKSRKLKRLIDTFTESVATVAFEADAAGAYGALAAELTARGTPIGALDTMIAAHALSLSLILVTNNARHFERVRGLRCENWL